MGFNESLLFIFSATVIALLIGLFLRGLIFGFLFSKRLNGKFVLGFIPFYNYYYLAKKTLGDDYAFLGLLAYIGQIYVGLTNSIWSDVAWVAIAIFFFIVAKELTDSFGIQLITAIFPTIGFLIILCTRKKEEPKSLPELKSNSSEQFE